MLVVLLPVSCLRGGTFVKPKTMAEQNKEKDVIVKHNSLIVQTISGDLNHFIGKFIEKGFLTSEVAADIRSKTGVGRRDQARDILEAVLVNLGVTQNKQAWFNEFVAMFSTEAPYKELAMALLSAYQPGEPRPSQSQTQPDSQVGQLSERILDIDDLFDISSELTNVAAKWKSFGLALRLNPDRLAVIETSRHDDCLNSVLNDWLKQKYDTERFGLPSWKLLVVAVAHPNGGQDPALASKLAKKYKVPMDF